ncbi:hypothetical protein TK90_2767 (plasmid) [Thioalkalivibrio sp. K90mix]|uniref:hypothetical protein n=1 Tax=Thioalkalivibrio sp. (strain K90mix) TaxID=396595 RepID=UPI000195A5FB|nr:hypothetical protein [Thioalkalivibrio sp. K90mix]ADC73252.1 hypothetical protein TK90_2767 [Thioalkalivibrio sp. K90mix]
MSLIGASHSGTDRVLRIDRNSLEIVDRNNNVPNAIGKLTQHPDGGIHISSSSASSPSIFRLHDDLSFDLAFHRYDRDWEEFWRPEHVVLPGGDLIAVKDSRAVSRYRPDDPDPIWMNDDVPPDIHSIQLLRDGRVVLIEDGSFALWDVDLDSGEISKISGDYPAPLVFEDDSSFRYHYLSGMLAKTRPDGSTVWQYDTSDDGCTLQAVALAPSGLLVGWRDASNEVTYISLIENPS